MFFDHQYQVAYVTRDLRSGAAILIDQFGAPAFKGLDGDHVIRNRVQTSGGEADIAMRAAVTVVGGLTLELLEPISGAIGIFTEMLTRDRMLCLHHLGMRCTDIDAMAAAHARQGREVVMVGGYRSARFIYVDARKTLGHYLEYASAPPEYWAARAQQPA